MIRTRDHEPPHVHCVAPDIEVLITIETQNVIRNHGVHSSDVKRLKEFIKANADILIDEWRHYHEKD